MEADRSKEPGQHRVGGILGLFGGAALGLALGGDYLAHVLPAPNILKTVEDASLAVFEVVVASLSGYVLGAEHGKSHRHRS